MRRAGVVGDNDDKRGIDDGQPELVAWTAWTAWTAWYSRIGPYSTAKLGMRAILRQDEAPRCTSMH